MHKDDTVEGKYLTDDLPQITYEELNHFIQKKFGVTGEFANRDIPGKGIVRCLVIKSI